MPGTVPRESLAMAVVLVKWNLPCRKVPWIKCIEKAISRDSPHPKRPSSKKKTMMIARMLIVDVESSCVSFFVVVSCLGVLWR
jgi:hypothetical protein